jgi:Fur family ferric uptake transcriptional regulator
VLDGSGTRYALCAEACRDHHHHQHDHVHFKCSACGETNCLNQVKVSMPALPQGYEASEINLLIEGICPRCR